MRRLCLTILCSTACAGVPAAPPVAVPLGPGTISLGTPNSAYLGSFTPDGREFYFFRKTPGDAREEHYRIFVSRRQGDGWSVADTLRLGESPSDLYAAIDPTGRYLVISTYRRAPGDTTARPSASIWMARRTAGGWSAPEFVPVLAQPGAYHSWVMFLPDGRLSFKRSSGDYRTALGEFTVEFRDGVFGTPVRSDFTEWLRAAAAPLFVYDAGPCPDPDCAILTAAPERGAPADLYVMRFAAGEWGTPHRLEHGVNSAGFENFPTFTPDGDLVFVRDFREYWIVARRAWQ